MHTACLGGTVYCLVVYLFHAEKDFRSYRPGDARHKDIHMQTSARNVFKGKVAAVHSGAVNDEVELSVEGGLSIVASITQVSTKKLGLKPGVEAIALIKASWIIVTPIQYAFRFSTSNQLHGTIQRVINHALEREIAIQLDGGNVIYAQQGHTSFSQTESQRWRPGDRVEVVIDASSVILGVAN